ncbi:MAG: gluconate 2-dehydrogenase subunit 3 family protein [Acidobacteriaceae bacterium]|nr:gluconate 2-dehydrogenase subunit 3 family protein [Acidobacteriaceae bacterium]
MRDKNQNDAGEQREHSAEVSSNPRKTGAVSSALGKEQRVPVPAPECASAPFALSRRNIFQIIGSVPVAAAALAEPRIADAAEKTTKDKNDAKAGEKAAFERKVFGEHQWKTVCVLCDLIIPADERSVSATQAGVPEFIDDWLAFRTEQDGNQRLQAEILGGLMWIDRESNKLFSTDFVDIRPEQQKQILDRIAWPARVAKDDQPFAAFFTEFRNLTVQGFFSSKVGIRDLPYLGNTAVMEWKGCDPKVWAIIEQRLQNGYQGLVKPGKKST